MAKKASKKNAKRLSPAIADELISQLEFDLFPVENINISLSAAEGRLLLDFLKKEYGHGQS